MTARGTPRIVVRAASPDDVPAMLDVHARSWRDSYTGLLAPSLIEHALAARAERAERWRTRIEDPAFPGAMLVAEVDGHVAGFAFTGTSRDEDAGKDIGEVYALYLDPPVIGWGVGRRLFAAAVDDLAASGFARGTLWVLTGNRRARRFYEAAGWRPDGTTKHEERYGGTLDETRYRLDPLPGPGGTDAAGATGR